MKPAILFLCKENACRSQMAQGFVRHITQGRVESWSAGTLPAGYIDATAVAVMKEVGVDLTAHHSKGLQTLPTRPWDYLVRMGCNDPCPLLQASLTFQWQIRDPRRLPLDEFRKVRDHIHRQVKDLLNEIRRLTPRHSLPDAYATIS